MAFKVPENIKKLKPYEPLSGFFRVRLDANESPYAPSGAALLELAQSLASSELNRYPDSGAAECCLLFSRRYNVPQQYVMAGNGSDELLQLIIGSLAGHGAKIALFDVDFSMYRIYAEIAGQEVVTIQKRRNLEIDMERVVKVINEQDIDLLIFSNPCNPTSIVLPREKVIRLLNETGALIVVDEAYMDFSPDDSVIDLVGEYDRLIVLKTCSKAAGLAGARIGFAAAGDELITALRSIKSPYNVNTLSQMSAAAVLRDTDYLDEIAKSLILSAQSLYDSISALRRRDPEKITLLPPVSANFVYVETPMAEEIYNKLLLAGISVRLLPGALRITAGSEKQNRELLNKLSEILL